MKNHQEHPLWEETQSLRKELDKLSQLYESGFSEVSTKLSDIELKLRKETYGELDELREEGVHTAGVELTTLPFKNSVSASASLAVRTDKALEKLPIASEAKPRVVIPKLPKKKSTFEVDFGKVWFVRIGIVILLTGLVFLGNFAYQNWIKEMPNIVRLLALFACAIGLAETGRRLTKKAKLNHFGEVLLAGGMAFFYYCTFASHFVERLKVIDHPVIGAFILFVSAGLIGLISWKRQAKATAILSIVLATYSTMLQPIGWMSCLSSVLLGFVGVFLMLRPGWTTPGWVSMIGTYLSFLGWQLMGASGMTDSSSELATLWFLPIVWAMFVVPSVLGRFRASLSDRMRSWFTAINNGLFYLLFSGTWLAFNGVDHYWIVASLFGVLLVTLGVIGRKQASVVGDVSMAQGLACITLGIVIKFQGEHISIVLAMESLLLALAAYKYRGRCESVFSLICGVLAGVMVLPTLDNIAANPDVTLDLSYLLLSLLFAAASVTSIKTVKIGDLFAPFVRASGSILFCLSSLVMIFFCYLGMGEPWNLILSSLLFGGFSYLAIEVDRKKIMPELAFTSLVFLLVAFSLIIQQSGIWAISFATVIALGSTWIWHREWRKNNFSEKPKSLVLNPLVPASLFAFAAPVFLSVIGYKSSMPYLDQEKYGSQMNYLFGFSQIGAFCLAVLGLWLRSNRLAFSASIYSLVSLTCLMFSSNAIVVFVAALLALLATYLLSREGAKQNDHCLKVSSVIFRVGLFINYCAGLESLFPGDWKGCLSLTVIVITVVSLVRQKRLLIETFGLLAIPLFFFVFDMLTNSWSAGYSFSGWEEVTLVSALLLLSFSHRQKILPNMFQRFEKSITFSIVTIAYLATTLWASYLLITHYGFKPVGVLWTVLGFAFVSTGLWKRLKPFRIGGFVLLILSFAKLFLVDVWDFTAFLRVSSFIVLGVALILLGLFYSKFAPMIKVLLEEEQEKK
ncbi:DUF2339 domain-containing protein [Akkermansiaceae bacterium]|nr:DUF2339 domain-containing protein [Akkermansiaceae bacterium]